MRKHCVTRDDLASNRQYPQQFQSRFVFVRLGIYSQLSHGGVNLGGVRSHKVNCGSVAVATPTGRFPIDRDMKSGTCLEASLNPTTHAGLELCYIDPSENPRIGGFAQTTPSGESEEVQELATPLFTVLDNRLVARHARKHAHDSQSKKCGERMSLTFSTAWILNAFKELQQRRFGIHASILIRRPFVVIMLRLWI